MSDILQKAVEALTAKLGGVDFGGSAKFEIDGQGAVVVDSSGVRISDEATDVTIGAAADVFSDLMAGDLDPTMAYMSQRLRIDGDMGMAMKLAQQLA